MHLSINLDEGTPTSHIPSLPTNASLYMRFASLCEFRHYDLHEIKRLIPDVPLCTSLILGPVSDERGPYGLARPSTQLSDLLRISLEVMRISSGADFWSNTVWPELRYCPTCMQMGYHSYLFQYLGVATCPLHQCQLTTKCISCNRALRCEIRIAVNAPFSCHSCGHLFKQRRFQHDSELQMRAIDAIIGDYRRSRQRTVVTGKTAGPPAVRLDSLLLGDAPMKPALVARTIARNDDWREPLISKIQFKTSEHWIPKMPRGSQPVPMRWGTVGSKTLRTLFHSLADYEKECTALHWRNPNFSGLVFNGEATHIATALCLLCNQLQVWPLWLACRGAETNDEALDTGNQLCQRITSLHSDKFPPAAVRQVADIICEADILGLFCCILHQLGWKRWLREVEWWRAVPRHLYEAGVRVQDVGGLGHKLQVRPRASWQMINFLCCRYRNRILKREPR